MLTPPAALEAILFASGEPVEKKELAKLIGCSAKELEKVIEVLDASLKDRGLALIEAGEEVELRTNPAAADFVKRLRESELSRDLGKAGLETLAAIAYGEGSTRGEVDWIRGVNSSTSIRSLLMRGLIEGREDEADRRRTRYSLTTEALAHLGVGKARDLPRFGELAKQAGEVKTAAETAESTE